jgi:hypothetical protein
VAGPGWRDDDAADAPRIAANAAALVRALRDHTAAARSLPLLDDARAWHAQLYAGCDVPVDCYLGHFRGDPTCPELVDYEVGLGPVLGDGYPERMGIPAALVADELDVFIAGVHRALGVLDSVVLQRQRPRTVDELHSIVALIAEVHGEWVRIHPFANGNGRTARIWAAFLALRYGLPVFVRLKPRPDDVAYARAAKRSMGRPPDFRGDHSEAVAVFGHMLSLSLLA